MLGRTSPPPPLFLWTPQPALICGTREEPNWVPTVPGKFLGVFGERGRKLAPTNVFIPKMLYFE